MSVSLQMWVLRCLQDTPADRSGVRLPMDAELGRVPQRRGCQRCIEGESAYGDMSHAVREATSGDNYEVFALALQFTSELIQPFLAPGHRECTGDSQGML